jgi:hypothetical protein
LDTHRYSTADSWTFDSWTFDSWTHRYSTADSWTFDSWTPRTDMYNKIGTGLSRILNCAPVNHTLSRSVVMWGSLKVHRITTGRRRRKTWPRTSVQTHIPDPRQGASRGTSTGIGWGERGGKEGTSHSGDEREQEPEREVGSSRS